jgi:NAD(P)-dependent dehydrogenase (short-subunit alcohol dehydrogenase family)
MEGHLNPTIAVVTGSASGIGAETAYVLESAGHYVIGIDRAYPETSIGTARTTCSADIREPAPILACIERALVLNESSGLNILVHAAAIGGPRGVLGDVEAESQAETLDVDAIGALSLLTVLARKLAPASTVVLMGAFAGITPYADFVSYSMAKAAVRGLADGIRVTLAEQGIRVSLLIPGPTATPMQFEHDPWHTLLAPKTIAAVIQYISSQSPGVCIEEVRIRAIAKGEVSSLAGPTSRKWPPSSRREGE